MAQRDPKLEPELGEKVHVWPTPGLKVQEDANLFGRFLPPEGRLVHWSPFHHSRRAEGVLHLVDPREGGAKAERGSSKAEDPKLADKQPVAAPGAPAGKE
jgi:hypothetical protein